MRRHVGKVQDLPSGSRKIVPLGGRSGIGVFNVNGKFHAVKNVCPHQGGPLCQGRLRPHVRSSGPYHVTWEREGEILKCPWHNWEFDLKTGRAPLRSPAAGEDVPRHGGGRRCLSPSGLTGGATVGGLPAPHTPWNRRQESRRSQPTPPARGRDGNRWRRRRPCGSSCTSPCCWRPPGPEPHAVRRAHDRNCREVGRSHGWRD